MVDAPGTVSRILWHFTGGPIWNEAEKKQNRSPKPAADAYAAMLSILETKQLRIGRYKEVVKVRMPIVRRWDRKSKRFVISRNVLVELVSAPICSLADIPAAHLAYHAQRYGEFAIGFHRAAAIQAGFNPVFYTLHDTAVIRTIYEGFGELRYADANEVRSAAEEIDVEVAGAKCEHDHEIDIDVSSWITDIEVGANNLESATDAAKASLETFLALVKTFDVDEFATIYTEREWRAVRAFEFSLDDVAMIVVPRKVGKEDYFDGFVRREVPRLRLPRAIPIVPWEDLVEY